MRPTISIITCSYNPPIPIWQKSLESIKNQKYPQDKIEHIVMDGGTKNGALALSRKYNMKIISRPDLSGSEQSLMRMSEGIKLSKGEIILLLETDNILVEKSWMEDMVSPFMDTKIVASFSMYNSYEKIMPLVTKYSALIGVNDPLVYYLGKSEKMPIFKKKYDLGKILSENKIYYTVKFNKENLPTLGDNGHMVRRKYIMEEIKSMKKFYHTDAFYNLLLRGYDTYGVVKNSIIHYTGSSLITFFEKRTLYKSQFYDNNTKNRSYFVYNPHSRRDIWNLIKFIIYSLTLIQPIIFSIRGYMAEKDKAWFIHPLACILAVVYYAKSEVTRRL